MELEFNLVYLYTFFPLENERIIVFGNYTFITLILYY